MFKNWKKSQTLSFDTELKSRQLITEVEKISSTFTDTEVNNRLAYITQKPKRIKLFLSTYQEMLGNYIVDTRCFQLLEGE